MREIELLLFIIYSAICLLAIRLNKDGKRRKVAFICFLVLLAGMAIDPLIGKIDPIAMYAIISTVTAIAIVWMPWARRYEGIKIILWLSLTLFFICAVMIGTPFYIDIPYVMIVHTLNIAQSFILLLGSEIIYDGLYNRMLPIIHTRAKYNLYSGHLDKRP